MLNTQPIRQIGYYVEDIRQAAERHHKLFGSGPFFLMENMHLPVKHRGRDTEFSHSAAFGQWGNVQVELMQAIGSGPSILHDLYPEGSGRYGLHHVSLLVDDFEATVADMKSAGFEEALRAYMQDMDMPAVFIDAVARYGHFFEIFPKAPKMMEFFDMVERAAKNFDGKNLICELAH